MRNAVYQNKLHLRIPVLGHIDWHFEEEAGSYHYLCPALDGKVDPGKIRIIALFRRLIVFVGNAFFLGILNQALPRTLIERLVVDGSQVRNQRKFKCFALL